MLLATSLVLGTTLSPPDQPKDFYAKERPRDARGTEYTLYQSHLNPDAQPDSVERETVVDGVRIRRHEGGLFFALAQSGP